MSLPTFTLPSFTTAVGAPETPSTRVSESDTERRTRDLAGWRTADAWPVPPDFDGGVGEADQPAQASRASVHRGGEPQSATGPSKAAP